MSGSSGKKHHDERGARQGLAGRSAPRAERTSPRKTEREGQRRGRDGGLLGSRAAAAGTIFLLSFLLYANTLGHQFVWDDFDLVVRNTALRPLDASAVKTSFTEGFWPAAHRGGEYYRPLTTLSYYANYGLSGAGPSSYHWMNVIMNALVTAAVFVFVASLFQDGVLGWVTAVLFAFHPVHTENVAWVAGRTDIGAALWLLASLIGYVRFKRRKSRPLLAFSLMAFALALFSKESAVFMPLLVALFEMKPLRRLVDSFSSPVARRSAIATIALYLAVLGVYLIARGLALGTIFSGHPSNTPNVWGAIALPFSILAGYVFKLVAPLSLNGEYDAPIPSSLFHPHAIAGVVTLALIVWAAARYRQRPVVVLGAGIFLLGLLPVLNIVPIGEVSAERFLYFPSLGFVLVLGGIFSPALAARMPSLKGSLSRSREWVLRSPASEAAVLVLLFAVLVVGYSVRTLTRNGDWRNEAVFFAKTAAQSPQNPRAQFNLGDALRAQGDMAGAIQSYQRAIELRPGYEEALSNLAGVYAQQGEHDKAVALIAQALKTLPDNARLFNNLGVLYLNKQNDAKAAGAFEKAVALNPNEFSAHLGLGMIRFREGNATAARDHLLRAARGGPSMAIAYFHLATLEKSAGNLSAAKEYANRFLSLYTRDDAYRRQAVVISAGQ